MADHLRVHQQAKMLGRFGVELTDQPLCRGLQQSAELLQPLYDRMKACVLSSKVVGTDDTPMKVLDRRWPHTRKGRFWPYVGDREHPAVVYDYTPTRERAGPEKFLSTYKGNLQLDAYPTYDKFFLDPKRELVEVAVGRMRGGMCSRHATRTQHYAVENRARQSGVGGEDLRLPRDAAARPVVEQLNVYLLRIQPVLLPRSDAGQAVAYLLKNWLTLMRYLEDGDLAIDNNRNERSLRGVAVGRNNWTFLRSDRGGRTMAILRSFVSSFEINSVNPFAWFRDVLRRIDACFIHKLEELFLHR